jgi:hypothetical protein
MNRVLFVALSLILGQQSYAQVPRTLSYQGALTDASGVSKPDGSYDLTFTLYAVPSGGSAAWSETQSVQVKRGLFSAILGSVTPLPDSLTFSHQYWLGVKVGADAELSPRVQLTSVGSSIRSAHADRADDVSDNSITGSKIADGEVVRSLNGRHDDVTLQGGSGASVTTNGNTITISASGGGGTGIQGVQNTDGSLSITNGNGPTATINLHSPFIINSDVGIGVNSPASKLDVNGGSGGGAAVGIHGSSNDNYGISGTSNTSYGLFGESAGSNGLYARTYAAGKYAILAGFTNNNSNFCGLSSDSYALYANGPSYFNGTMGIGVTSPAAKLDVNGGSGTGSPVGIHGSANDNYGVYGTSNSSFGVYGESGATAVRARTYNPSGWAVFADYSTSSTNFCALSSGNYSLYANGPVFLNGSVVGGAFVLGSGGITSFISGNLHVAGDFDASGSKDFLIDHPLDPANKTLTHSCIESNERLLMYSGTVVTDGNGEATIDLPSYFEALNINYRYQLTIVGGGFAQSRVSKEINDNRFSIQTDKPNIKVCWLVIGDRNDAYSRAHPLVVEEEKKGEDRGKYLAPELYGQPADRAIGYVPHPVLSGSKGEEPGTRLVHPDVQPPGNAQ